MSEVRYQYLFNEFNELVHYKKAIKGDKYRLYPGLPLDYIFRAGNHNVHHFSLKAEPDNPFASISSIGGKGESIEHYNSKMEIVDNKKYYDTIFKKWIEFDEIKFETTYDNKRPDLSCLINNELVCCIEIYKTNAKSELDILELKKIGVPIIEININDENKCKHLILPTLLEANRQKLADINFRLQEFKQEQQGLETEYNRLADKLQAGSSRITTDIKYFEINFKAEVKRRFDKIDNWLQARLKRFGVEADADQKIKSIERELKKFENEGEKRDYRIGKLESEVKSVESKINQSKQSFNKIAEQSKIEWFRNNWMSYSPQNVVEEIKYWLL